MTSSSSGAAASTGDSIRRFGPFELDARAGELRREGVVVKLQPQPLRVLALLVERAGELVTREELQRALWGTETYVDFERGLNFCINQVRAALGDSADTPRYIQTLPRRGYRFIAPLGSDPGPTRVRAGSEEGQSGVGGGSDPQLNVGRDGSWQVIAAGVAFLALLVTGAIYVAGVSTATAPAAPPKTMIAVLPLEDLTGDPPPAWFADGLTDELISQVGRVSPQRLGVIARTSSMAYRGAGKSIADIGRELGVSHVVEGTLRREGNRLRITVQLVNVADQARVWSDTYDRSAHGALTIQSEIAAQVTRALALELLPAPWTSATWTGTHRPDARDAYLRGKFFLQRAQAGDLRLALEQFETATRLDPSFAAAHAGRAEALHLSTMFGQMTPAEAYTRAGDAAAEAMRLDANLADANAAAGLVQLWGRWNPAAAADLLARAVAINPSDAGAHHDLAWAKVALRRFDEAVAHIERARELDPLSTRANTDIGWLYLQIGQPSAALRACRQTLALDPRSIEAQQCIERAHLQRGEIADALAAARAAASIGSGPIPAALELDGSPQEQLTALWQSRLARLERLAGERPISPYTLAMHHAVLGNDEQTLASLEDAYQFRSASLVLLATDPLFERLRTHPRFVSLLQRIRGRD